jgi:hypothetical protein
MADNLKEFKADHSGGVGVPGAEVMEPVVGAGGPVKKRLADANKSVNPTAEKVTTVPGGKAVAEEAETTDEAIAEELESVDVTESFNALFEGMDLSEDFKSKVSLVFEAAVNEAVSVKTAEIAESLQEEFAEKLEESVTEAMEEVVENLDNYLDYIVSEWMEENKVAIEAGIKVEMAESLMSGLKDLFAEHNIEIDEETIDVVSALEEEVEEIKEEANKAINEAIALREENEQLRAEKVFFEMTEGLTTSQVERLRVLSEKLNVSDLDSYASDLSTLKESFFKSKAPVLTESAEEESEIITEEAAPRRVSQYDSVNAIVAALNSKSFK